MECSHLQVAIAADKEAEPRRGLLPWVFTASHSKCKVTKRNGCQLDFSELPSRRSRGSLPGTHHLIHHESSLSNKQPAAEDREHVTVSTPCVSYHYGDSRAEACRAVWETSRASSSPWPSLQKSLENKTRGTPALRGCGPGGDLAGLQLKPNVPGKSPTAQVSRLWWH